MKLNKKFICFKKYIVDENNIPVFRIKSESTFSSNEVLCNRDNAISFSMCKYEKSDKFVINDHVSKDRIYANVEKWINVDAGPFKLSYPKEFFVEGKNIHNNISIKRNDSLCYDIYVNGIKDGKITNKFIESETITDKELLAILYVFSKNIIYDEKVIMISNLISSYV